MTTLYQLRHHEQALPEALEPEIEKRYSVIAREAHGIFIEKNNAYKSVFIDFGVNGIYVRIRDKLARLVSTEAAVADEGVVENLLDIANYALMGAMIDYFDLKRGEHCLHLYEAAQSEGKFALRCVKCGQRLELLTLSSEQPRDL